MIWRLIGLAVGILLMAVFDRNAAPEFFGNAAQAAV